MGVGVVVGGERGARGMELVTREEARGRGVVGLGTGVGGVGWEAASSHAARAEGSMGQAGGGGSVGGGWMLLEEVFPMVVELGEGARRWSRVVRETLIWNHGSLRPGFSQGER